MSHAPFEEVLPEGHDWQLHLNTPLRLHELGAQYVFALQYPEQ